MFINQTHKELYDKYQSLIDKIYIIKDRLKIEKYIDEIVDTKIKLKKLLVSKCQFELYFVSKIACSFPNKWKSKYQLFKYKFKNEENIEFIFYTIQDRNLIESEKYIVIGKIKEIKKEQIILMRTHIRRN